MLTLPEIIAKSSSVHSERLAFIEFSGTSRTITYSQLNEFIKKFISEVTSLGVKRESRVAIVLPNGLDISLVLLGVSSVAISVPLSQKLTENEFLFYLKHSKCSFLLTQEKGYPQEAISAAGKLGLTIITIDSQTQVSHNLISQKKSLSKYTLAKPSDIAIIFLTSGSTGSPKIVPLTHLNVCTSAQQVSMSLNLTKEDRCLCMWEQYHIGGFVDLLLAPIYSGGAVVSAGKFNVDNFFSSIEKFIPTWFQGVPTTLVELTKIKPEYQTYRSNNFRFIRSVAAALSPAHMLAIEKKFGVPVIQTFGMTEASPLITTNELPPGIRKPGSVGKTCGTEVAIMDANNNVLPRGSQGQIAIKGDNVFRGYENNTEANMAQFNNGWFYTGDIGYFDDDDFLYLTGRSKELINKGGEKISPYEIEAIINKHSSILECAVFSVPHSTLGEDIAAGVVLRENMRISDEELKNIIAENLSQLKIPTNFIFLDKLPKNDIGKIIRSELSEIYQNSNLNKTPTSPQNHTQRILFDLWTAEVHNQSISINDDFQSIGGDSLSYIRILSAIEKIFNIELSRYKYLDLNTIEKMSNLISKISTQNHSSINIPNIKTMIYHNSFLEISKYPDFNLLVSALVKKTTLHDFVNFRESLLTFATPLELTAIIEANIIDKQSQNVIDNHAAWSESVLSELKQHSINKSWSRTSIGSNANLYKFQHSNSEKLIVALTGTGGRLMMPIYRFLLNLDSKHDLLILQIPESGHYKNGIPGCGRDLLAVGEWIYNNFYQKPYDRIITMGVSAGAIPALIMNLKISFDQVILVSPESINRHPTLKALLSEHLNNITHIQHKVNLVFSEKNISDHAAINELNVFLVKPKRFILKNSKSHLVLHEIWKKGFLNKFLRSLLN